MAPKDDPDCYFFASTSAAILSFPMWKASAVAQSGFKVPNGTGVIGKYIEIMKPPYHGVVAVIGGMSWARGAIFYGSDSLKELMSSQGYDLATSTLLPPMMISTFVQIVNQPLVRASITIQDPASSHTNTIQAIRWIIKEKGWTKLWHGTSAGIMKTVPKYCTAIAIKDSVEAYLPKSEHPSKKEELNRSAIKSVTAGVAGAALTNPLDVIRNEMFKTDKSIVESFKHLMDTEGAAFMARGMSKNLIAVAIPITLTIFATDVLVGIKNGDKQV